MSESTTRAEPLEQWFPLFRERVRRLAEFVELRAPSAVMAMAVEMVYRAAFCAYPDVMGRAVANAQLEHSRQNAGMCVGCGIQTGDLAVICEVCMDEGKEDDEDSEFVK